MRQGKSATGGRAELGRQCCSHTAFERFPMRQNPQDGWLARDGRSQACGACRGCTRVANEPAAAPLTGVTHHKLLLIRAIN